MHLFIYLFILKSFWVLHSIGPGWVWCHGPADVPRPLLLSTSICMMDCGSLDRGLLLMTNYSHNLSYLLNVLQLCNDIYCFCPSGERDPPLLLSWRFLFPFFSPVKGFFSISWEFFLTRCEVLGQGCRMYTDCKALWGKFVICDIGLYTINWIERKLYICRDNVTIWLKKSFKTVCFIVMIIQQK